MILAQPAVKTKIHYDRSSKTWQAINGTVTNCVTRQEALIVALQHDHPALGAKVESIARSHGYGKTIMNGLLKAAKLIVSANVFNNGEVASQSRPDVYHRTNFDGTVSKYTCSCEATVYDSVLGKICAHCLAQHLAYLLNLELSPPPIPFAGEAVVIGGRKPWNGCNEAGYSVNDEIDIDQVMTTDRDTALPAPATRNDRIENHLGYDKPAWYYTPAVTQIMAKNGLSRDEAAQMFMERD